MACLTVQDARTSFTKSVINELILEENDTKVKETEDQLVKNCTQVCENYDKIKEIQTEWKINISTVTHSTKIEGKYEVSTQEIPEIRLEKGKSVPPMRAWRPINRNILTTDESTLDQVPYMGDAAIEKAQQNLNSTFKLKPNKSRPSNNSAQMLHWGRPFSDKSIVKLVDRLTDSSKFETFIDKLISLIDEQPMDIKNNLMGIITKDDAFKLIAEQFPRGSMTSAIVKEIYKDHMESLQKTSLMPNFDSEWDKVYSAEQAMSTFESLFCNRCFTYDCNLHRVPTDTIKMKYRPQMAYLDYHSPCGDDCFLNIETVRPENYLPHQIEATEKPKISPMNIKTDHWTFQDKTLFNVCVRPFQLNFCRIAPTFIGKTCSEVFAYWESLDEQTKDEHMQKIKEDKEKTMMDAKKNKSRKKTNFWKKHAEKVDEKLFNRFNPCEHSGPCGPDVIGDCCVKRGTYCEKFCNCRITCDNRFPGCSCKGACNSNRCSCYYASRECDPDLCKDCGAGELSLLEQREKYKCENVSIQRNWCKHLCLGRSQVSGWGIFLKGTAKKGDFISEYRGEIVSEAETDLRGKLVYDQKKASYLFKLNNDQCVDAALEGNKIRFANHSQFPNCNTKMKTVNGDSRIGVYANTNIADGEELFIDYRYGTDQCLDFVPIERGNQKRK